MTRALVAIALSALIVMLVLLPGCASQPGTGPAPGLMDGSQTLPNTHATTSADAMAELPPDIATAVAVSRMICPYEEAKAVVEAFLDAFNRGDQTALAQFFGRRFKWWSATYPDEPHFAAYRFDVALPYFVRRHGDGERLALREFHLSDPSGRPPRDFVNFWYFLDRTFQNQTFLVMGKGTMHCEAREIFVWSMGFPPVGVTPNSR